MCFTISIDTIDVYTKRCKKCFYSKVLICLFRFNFCLHVGQWKNVSISSRIARRFWVLLPASQHREREFGLCTSRQKSVCEVCKNIGESESEWIRESTQEVWGAGESGVARGPETEVVRGCQMDEKAVSCRGCVVGRVVMACVISGRGTVFFYYRQRLVHKGLRYSLSPPSLPSCCVRTRTCKTSAY